MSVASSSSAQAAREALAARLRDLRLDAGLKGADIAERCGWSASKSSRIESARTAPTDDDVRAWCRACDALGEAEDLVAANRQADQMYVRWRRLQRHGMRRSQEEVLPLYDRTRAFRVYCSNVVPGMLQTQAYASALLSTIAQFQGNPNDSEAAAATRLERFRVIQEGDHRFALLLEETVLRYRIGDPSVMAGQLGYLLAVMGLPNVSLGIIPFDAPRPMWPLEAFYGFDDGLVVVETLTARLDVTAPSEIGAYLRAFGVLAKIAVYGADARALIASALETHG
ncbi:helix-turn-helix domain-containing protein [Streptacidiphilus anmyonensis]|uniref:helix-turn-helix domain-containing protein n=1 Tax=Streptacidiphilus anmyonensis TaxID=405782 RepID=UPI0005A706B8|nr:helix-turn-helix transcriptional regulator [Streptacidiphilus anmyonensis]